jgi:hypothetical protein
MNKQNRFPREFGQEFHRLRHLPYCCRAQRNLDAVRIPARSLVTSGLCLSSREPGPPTACINQRQPFISTQRPQRGVSRRSKSRPLDSFAGPAIATLIITAPRWLVNVNHLTRLEILPSSQRRCTYPIGGGKDTAKVAGSSITALKGVDGVPSIISLR